MKKSLIALAVLGTFAGAAAAQSTATLYGKIDVGYGVSNNGAYELGGPHESKFQQFGNANSTSRWGLKGSEDLGNGLKAYFNLEQGFNPESGADKGGFDRAAFVGIAGNFGAIQAGRQTHVINNVLGQFDLSGSPNVTSALGNAGISAISQNANGGGLGTYSRVSSAIAYVSPNFSGFSFQGAVVLKNDDIFGLDGVATGVTDIWGNPRLIENKTIYTVGAQYNYGGFTIGAAYESKPADVPGVDISASWGIGAKYDFGSFVVSGGYFDNHFKSDGKGFYLGVKAPIGAFTVGAQIAYNTKAYNGTETNYVWFPNASTSSWNLYSYSGDREVKPLAWELFAYYNLSKRTQLYLQYGGINNDAEEYLGASRKYSANFGLIHNF